MACKNQVESLTEEVICSICLEFYTDPVSVECGHSFCRSCITQCWESEQRISCPECREELAEHTLRGSWTLARLAEKARKLDVDPTAKGTKHHCQKHQEALKLFCEIDKQLICVICRDAREHRDHRFLPTEEAAEVYKEQVKSALESLKETQSVVQAMEQQQKEKISGVLEQSGRLQSFLTSQFAELHQSLSEKQQRLLRDLREEEERILNKMEKNLQEIQKSLESNQEKLSKLQEQMEEKDNVLFLKWEADRKNRVSDDSKALSVTEGALPAEKFDHPFLLNTMMRETYDHSRQVSVTLDEETAHPELEVSEDGKRVQFTLTKKDFPKTGKRFTSWSYVLGLEGFTSGRCYWEVEVVENQYWSLGVAAESVDRNEESGGQVPENGFWTITQEEEKFYADSSPASDLRADPIPEKVGVYLSYESGTISFYDADTKTHLYTFTGNKFTEKLYPLFATWDKDNWLRICSSSAPDL